MCVPLTRKSLRSTGASLRSSKPRKDRACPSSSRTRSFHSIWSRMHSISPPHRGRDSFRLRHFRIPLDLHPGEKGLIWEHPACRRCFREPTRIMMVMMPQRMLIYINLIFRNQERKFNTPFSQRVNRKEFGRSFTKWSIAQMFYCMFQMLETLMGQEPSLLNIISSINVQISIQYSSLINAT